MIGRRGIGLLAVIAAWDARRFPPPSRRWRRSTGRPPSPPGEPESCHIPPITATTPARKLTVLASPQPSEVQVVTEEESAEIALGGIEFDGVNSGAQRVHEPAAAGMHGARTLQGQAHAEREGHDREG